MKVPYHRGLVDPGKVCKGWPAGYPHDCLPGNRVAGDREEWGHHETRRDGLWQGYQTMDVCVRGRGPNGSDENEFREGTGWRR